MLRVLGAQTHRGLAHGTMYSRSKLLLVQLAAMMYWPFAGCRDPEESCSADVHSFLRNFDFLQNMPDPSQGAISCKPHWHCNAVRSKDCLPTDLCGIPGTVECLELSTMPASELFQRFPQIADSSTRLINVPVGKLGVSFEMYIQGDHEWISKLLVKHGVFSPVSMAIVNDITSKECQGDHQPKLFVDLGCNLGLMSLIALANGCRTLCVEPNHELVPIVHKSILRNSFQVPSVVLHAAASAEWHEVLLSHVNQPSVGQVVEVDGIHAQAVALPLGDFLHGDALMLKVDVEWHEKQAGYGLNEWLRTHSWRHLLIEVKKDRLAILSVFLQGCKGVPIVRVFQEAYDEKLKSWDLSQLPITQVSLQDVNNMTQTHEDFWIECQPDPEW